MCRTYISLLVRETHVCVPDLEAVSQPWKLHLLYFHPEVGLKALHHLDNNPEAFNFKFPDNKGCKKQVRCKRNGSVDHQTHLPLNLDELLVHRIREIGATVVDDGEVTQLPQVHLRIQGQPVERK